MKRNGSALLFLFSVVTYHVSANNTTTTGNITTGFRLLYWELPPYIYTDARGKLTGILIDLSEAANKGAVEFCDLKYQMHRDFFKSFVSKSREEIEKLYEENNLDKNQFLFPILREPRIGNEDLGFYSEGIAVIALQRNFEMTLKFVFAFFDLRNLIIVVVLCVLCCSLSMLFVVSSVFVEVPSSCFIFG